MAQERAVGSPELKSMLCHVEEEGLHFGNGDSNAFDPIFVEASLTLPVKPST